MTSTLEEKAQPSSGITLYDYYKKTFETLRADTPELRRECFHLRYNVYCLENPFENVNDEKIETDEYDDRAVHFILKHKASGIFVGTARVIKAHTLDDNGTTLVPPVFRLCEKHGIILPSEYTPDNSIELSRLAISKPFRRRITDTQYPTVYQEQELEKDMAKNHARIIPCMTLGLIASVYQFAASSDTPYCVVVMTAALARLLGKLGIVFDPASEPIEYHGQRQIYTISRAKFFDSVSRLRPEILDIFTDGGRYK